MSFIHRIVNSFSRSKLEREIEAEIQSHLEMRIADNLAQGMSREKARRDALIRFGNPTVMKERVTAVDAEMVLDSLHRHFHYSARQLRKSPAFSIAAVLRLALGIGANVVAFGVLNSLMLRPLDVPQPEHLYNVVQQRHGSENQSYPDYVDLQKRNTTFTDLLAYRMQQAGLRIENAAYKCWYYKVSGNYFDMLGVRPALGRVFHPDDEHGANSAPYVVLSNAFWRSHFNADAGVVGKIVKLNTHPFTVIGVAPSGFHGTDLFIWPDFWIPMVNGQDYEGTNFLTSRGMHNIWVLGRLKPGISPQQATDNLNAIAHDLAREYPASDDRLSLRLVQPGLMGDMFGDPTRAFLSSLMLLAILVLLAACTNLGSLFAARAADRSRELAIRLAIGSTRGHIVRQLLSEAVLISLMGGCVGTVFSLVLLRVLSRWQPFPGLPVHVSLSADVRVFSLALLLSVVSGALIGLLPLKQIWSTNAGQTMRSETDIGTPLRRFAFRDLLLGVQIALCTVLVTASFVALRGMQRSLHAPIGFQPRGVILAETNMHMSGHSDGASLPIQREMLQQIAHLPEVTAVGTIDGTPLGTGGSTVFVYREGTADFRPSTSAFGAKYFSISPGYLQAAGTRLLSGRDFNWHDDAHGQKVAIVNQTFAHLLFGTGSALGQHFTMADKNAYEVVGIVENGKYDSLTERAWPAMFLSSAQNPDSDTTLVIRASLPVEQVVPLLNRVLSDIDPNLPFTFHSWEDALAAIFFPARIATMCLGVMGLLAAMLAITGIFGTAAYSVSKRIRELGIRSALGARPLQIMRSALGRPLVLLASGSAAGLVLGIIASRLLAQIVYQATPRDPLVLGGVISTMVLLGLVATWIPARNALAVDPAGLLREQ